MTQELREQLSDTNLETVFKSVDINGSGVLSKTVRTTLNCCTLVANDVCV